MEEKFNQLTNLVSKDLLSWGGLALLVVLLFYVVKKVLALRARKPEPPPPLPSIDVLNLSEAGPPSGPPVLELYHLPVRLAAVLLAPVGRARELPPPQQIPEVLDAVIPGLGKVFVKHRPIVRIWPAQLSPRVQPRLFRPRPAPRRCRQRHALVLGGGRVQVRGPGRGGRHGDAYRRADEPWPNDRRERDQVA